MSKKEFLENLFHALNGGMNKEEIYSHIQYYDEYIENEKMNGKSEEEVIKSLGNPRLIAKTILDSAKNSSYSQETYSSYEEQEQPKLQKKAGILDKVKKVLIIVLVCALAIFVIGAVLVVFWKIVLPILIVVWIVRQLYKLLK